MIDYHTPRFKTSEVARAAGIPAPTFRSYFSRKHFRVLGDMSKKADIHGLPNLFSLIDAMGFAVAIRLISAGVEPEPAWDAAMNKFAHTGDQERSPAHLFDIHERGETLLVYWPDTGRSTLLAADDFKSLSDLMGINAAAQEAAVVVVLNYLERRVFDALGV